MNKKQQYVLGSILFVFAFSFSLNEFIKVTRADQKNTEARTVANIEDTQTSQGEINWEHELARTLHETKATSEAKLGEKPTQMDQLVFGALQGKYNIEYSQGVVKSIRLKSSETLGVELNPAQIIRDHRSLFQGASDIELRSELGETNEYTWKDQSGVTHTMKVQFIKSPTDGERSIQSIEF